MKPIPALIVSILAMVLYASAIEARELKLEVAPITSPGKAQPKTVKTPPGRLTQCALVFKRTSENCRAAARTCLRGNRGNCDKQRQACEAKAQNDRRLCDIKKRKIQGQMKRGTKTIDRRGIHLNEPGKAKPAPGHGKKPDMRNAHMHGRSGAAINIRVNYIARKGAAVPGIPVHRAAAATDAVRITNVNYIARRPGSNRSPTRSSGQESSRIVISDINYIARKGQARSAAPGDRPASASQAIRITNINYVARKSR